MATQLNTTNHDALNNEMTNLFKSGSCCGVKMSVYDDEAATTLATDTNGNIENRKINQLLKTAAYTNPTTNQQIKANIKVIFSDGTSLISTDDIDTYYYKLSGETFTHRSF
jgi:hypothetical protein|tara:strand:+ start:528 stop:860 length:333 start_codon:yes stop_codon:yes gene_type:complete